MDIKDLAWNETQSNRFNNSIFPRNIWGLIVGKSNCEKNSAAPEFLTETGVVGLR